MVRQQKKKKQLFTEGGRLQNQEQEREEGGFVQPGRRFCSAGVSGKTPGEHSKKKNPKNRKGESPSKKRNSA